MAVGLLTIQDPYFTLNPYTMLHKINILLAATLMLLATNTWSQTLEDRIKTAYAPLAPFTPTGLLLDRSPLKPLMVDSLSPDLYFPGSPVHGTSFRFESLYNLFYHASYTGAPFSRHPGTLPILIDSLRLGYDVGTAPMSQIASMQTNCDVVMGSLAFNFNRIRSDAFIDNYVFLNAADDKFYLRLNPFQITDTIWTSGQPGSGNFIVQTVTIIPDSNEVLNSWKLEEQLFSFSALTPDAMVAAGAPVRFYFPIELNLSNLNNHTLEVDFQDGLGYVQIQPGQFKNIYYAEGGTKLILARIKNALGQVIGDLPSKTIVQVTFARFNSDIEFYSTSPNNCSVDLNDGVGIAKLSFKLAPSSNGVLSKPFILVEGFETKEFSKTNAELDNPKGLGFGQLNWVSFTSGFDPQEYPQMIDFPIVIDSLLSLGYDVGYVDFFTNRSKIQKNANALISLIELVDQELILNGSKEGVQLMGASMGGLISRLALITMENGGCCNSVKNYFTFSTPHRGANIPIASQYFTFDLGEKFNFLNLLDRSKYSYNNVLNSPAARQMLIVHREFSAKSEHNSLYSYLDSLGQPKNTKKIAIADGSLNAYLHRIDNTNLNSPVLNELQGIFDFELKLPAPTKILTLFDIPVRKFIMASAVGRSIEHSPNSTSSNWIYNYGLPIEVNLDDLWNQTKKWTFSVLEYALIDAFHQKASEVFPQYIVPITASRIILLNVSVARNENILNQRYLDNLHANSTRNYEYLAYASEGLDNAPGDYNNTVENIRKPFVGFGFDFAFSNTFPTATFVSTVSSLDEPYPTRHLLLNSNNQLSLTNFDLAWAKNELGKNEYYNKRHVTTSYSFRIWLLEALEKLENPSEYLTDELVGLTFNFGKPVNGAPFQTFHYRTHEFFSSLKIYSSSELKFNRMEKIGYSNAINSFLPIANSHLNTVSRNLNCTPVIVQNEGTIELGEPDISPFTNTAHVQFRSGSVLELFSNSTLNIHQGSRLTIDSGATLIIHPNATVYLEGNNSVLEIKGRVVFLPNAVFELTGGGYVLINQDSSQVANIFELWDAQGPATFKFHGQQSSQRLMELASVVRLSPRIKFDFKSGQINLHQSVVLDLFGDAELRNLQIQAVANQPHRGIYLHGQANVNINNITISGGEQAITSTMIQYRNPLVLSQCSIINNFSGVVTYGGQVNFTGSTFSGNSTAWLAYDMDGNSQISDCQFLSNDVGIDIMGQHDANLNITQSIIEQNVWGIKSFGQLYCRMNCSSVSDNTTGIYAGNYQWLLGGRSRNRFQNNQLAIRLEEVDNLFLFEGENDFSGSQMYISGTFSGIALNYLHFNPMTNSYELNVKDNRLPVVAGNTRVHLRDWDYTPVYLHNHTPMPQYMQMCDANQTVGFEDYVLQNWHSSILVDVAQTQLPLNAAVAQARSLITTNELQNTKMDLEAISLFDDILTQIRNQSPQLELSPKDYVILEIALNKMMEAHNNAYRFGLLPRVRAVNDLPKSIYLMAILNEVESRIAQETLNPSSERSLYSLILTKAQLLRTAEHYDYALETLQDLKSATDPYWSATGDYWECICNAEQKLITEIIKAETFESIRMECLLLGPQERRMQPASEGDPVRTTTNQANYSLFPNPANNTLFVRSDKMIGSASIRIVDMTGRVVSTAQWSDRGDLLEMDVAALKSGIYSVILTSDSQMDVLRFTKF